MWGKKFTHAQFVDLIGKLEQRRPAHGIPKIDAPDSHPASQSLWVLWANDPGEKVEWPNVIVVPDDQEVEFLAWTATFLPGFRPFTSFFRVLPWVVFVQLKAASVDPSLGNLEDAFLGAILGEAMTYTRSRTSFDTLAIQAFASTYSFSMTRATALQMPAAVLDSIGEACERARDLSGQSKRKPSVKELDEVWNVIRHLVSDAEPVFHLQPEVGVVLRACRELQHEKSMSRTTWNALTGSRIDFDTLKSEMSERKEDRVRLFEALVGEMIPDSSISLTASFVCGFLASLVSQGTLHHADLVFSVLDRFPTALVWYSVCVGLQPSSRLQSYNNGLGRRLLRDLLRPEHLFSRPYADVAINELQVFSNSESKKIKIHQRHAASLSVEIAPMVIVPLKSPSDKQEPAPSAISDVEPVAAVSLLTEMGRSLEKVQKLHHTLIDQFLKRQPSKVEPSPPARKSKKRKGWLFPE
jgi:hypothetical protein